MVIQMLFKPALRTIRRRERHRQFGTTKRLLMQPLAIISEFIQRQTYGFMALILTLLLVILSIPLSAPYIFDVLLGEDEGEAVRGDLEERRGRIAQVSGDRYAKFWYWSQVFRSIAPFAWAAFKRVSGIAAVAEALRRMR
jgi:hypothetical protein